MSDMVELAFKIVKIDGARYEVIAQIDDFSICKAAFEKALFIYPNEHLELRNGAQIIFKTKESSTALDVENPPWAVEMDWKRAIFSTLHRPERRLEYSQPNSRGSRN